MLFPHLSSKPNILLQFLHEPFLTALALPDFALLWAHLESQNPTLPRHSASASTFHHFTRQLDHFGIVQWWFLQSRDLPVRMFHTWGTYDFPLKLDRLYLTLLPHEDSSASISRPKTPNSFNHFLHGQTSRPLIILSSSFIPQPIPYLYEYSISLQSHLCTYDGHCSTTAGPFWICR